MSDMIPAKCSKKDIKSIKECIGAESDSVADLLLNQLFHVIPKNTKGDDIKIGLLGLDMQASLQPKDGLEALLCVQMIGVHNLTMNCLALANHPKQSVEGVTTSIERATKLLRTFTAQVETLNRHRGKGQQKVTVEHVTVNKGGQAIVGHVERRGVGVDEEK